MKLFSRTVGKNFVAKVCATFLFGLALYSAFGFLGYIEAETVWARIGTGILVTLIWLKIMFSLDDRV